MGGRTDRPGVRIIFRNAAYLTGSGMAAAVLRALYVVVVARGLGPEGYGVMSSLQAFYLMFVMAATAGLPVALSRQRAEEDGALDGMRSLAVSLSALALGAALFFGLGVAIEGQKYLYALFATAILARGLALWARALFLAREESQHQMRLTLWFRGGELLAVGLALAAGAGLMLVVLIHAASWLAEALIALALIRRRFGPLGPLRPRRAVAAAPGLIGASLAFATADWLRIAPLAAFRFGTPDGDAAGLFALAWNGALIVTILTIATMDAAAPAVARARARSDGKDTVWLSFCLRLAPALGAAAVIGALIAGPWIVTALGGRAYTGAALTLTIALAGIAPLAANHALDQALFLAGRARITFWANSAAAALSALAAVAMAGSLPTHGVAAAIVGVYLALMLGKLLWADRRLSPGLAAGALRALGACTIATGAAIAIAPVSPWFGALAGLVLLPFAMLILGAVSRAELRVAADTARGLMRRR